MDLGLGAAFIVIGVPNVIAGWIVSRAGAVPTFFHSDPLLRVLMLPRTGSPRVAGWFRLSCGILFTLAGLLMIVSTAS
jgi:hypothetical protein